jgi:hypothetical protein
MTVTWWDIVKFIRCISRRHLDRAEKDYLLNFVKKDVPWENIAAIAEMEGVSGLVYCNLRNMDLLDLIPTTAIRRLESSYIRTKKHSLAIIAEARDLSARLEQARVPVLALQGLSLFRLYGDAGLRPLGDMDLMVKPGRKGRLRELLKQAGYHAPYPAYPDILRKEAVLVDMHTHILNLDRIHSRQYIFPADLTSMWQRAGPFFDQQNGLLILDPFDNFVALAAHALKHSYSRLIWLVDLHKCLLEISANPGGWEEIVKRARFWQQEKIILYALILVESILGLKVPLRVKYELGIGRLNILEKYILRLKIRGFSSNELCEVLWLCNIRDAGNKLKFIKETVFPRDEIMAQIMQEKSWAGKRSGYAKRTADFICLVSSNLYRAFTF